MNRSLKSIPVSVIVFTLNEEVNLPRCLDSLRRFNEVIVVDSFSEDGTEAVCRDREVRFVQNRFEGFGAQRNWALDNLDLKNDWVLILDADERMSEELEREIAETIPDVPADVGAFRLKRRFHFWGRWLKHSNLYPTWVVRLVNKNRVRYENRGHAETQLVDGRTLDLVHDLIDENLKGIDAWITRQSDYASKDAMYELSEQSKPLRVREMFSSDPMARRAALKQVMYRMPARGFVYFLYSFVWKLGFLEGRDGFMFCRMRAMYQTMISIKKYDLCKQKDRARGD